MLTEEDEQGLSGWPAGAYSSQVTPQPTCWGLSVAWGALGVPLASEVVPTSLQQNLSSLSILLIRPNGYQV